MTRRTFSVSLMARVYVLAALAQAIASGMSDCDVVIQETSEAGAQLEAALAECNSPFLWVICFDDGLYTGFAPNGTVLATPTGANLTITASSLFSSSGFPVFDLQGGQGFIVNSGFTLLSSVNITNGVSEGDGGCLNVVGGGFEGISVTFSNCVSEGGNGGAIAVSTNAQWMLDSVTVIACSAKEGQGGGLYIEVPSVVPATINILIACLNNVANAGGGMAIFGNPSTQAPYSVFITAINNTATGGNGGGMLVMAPPSSNTSPKNIYVLIPPFFSRFASNSAAGDGGAVALINVNASVLTIFFRNEANGVGGAVYAADSDVALFSKVTYNVATSGGAVYAEGWGSLQMEDLIVKYNRATIGAGGGIFTSGIPVSGNTVTIENNVASEDGGGLYVESTTSPVVLTEVSLVNNTASTIGGSLCIVNGGGAMLSNVKVALSKASVGGGAAFLNAGPVSINGSAFELALEGSGIFVTGPTTTLTLSHSIVSSNVGAGLNCTAGSTVAINNVTNLLCSNNGPENLLCDATCSGCSSYTPPGGATTCGAQCQADPTLCIPSTSALPYPPCKPCHSDD